METCRPSSSADSSNSPAIALVITRTTWPTDNATTSTTVKLSLVADPKLKTKDVVDKNQEQLTVEATSLVKTCKWQTLKNIIVVITVKNTTVVKTVKNVTVIITVQNTTVVIIIKNTTVVITVKNMTDIITVNNTKVGGLISAIPLVITHQTRH